MGHSQAEKAENRERILDTAALQVREGGFDSVSIAELMKAVNLTHGGFYGHFASRADLISAALARAIEDGETVFAATGTGKAPNTVKSIANRYLSSAHRDDIGGGCAMPALAADVARSEDPEVRAIMAARLEDSFAQMAQAMGGGRKADNAAVAAWCAMIGAVILSRVFRGEKRSDQILKIAREAVLDLEGKVREAN